VWAAGWEKKGWVKKDGEIKNLDIIQDAYAIYQRIKDEDLKLTHVAAHVGTEGNELADRMAMYGALTKQENLRRYEGDMDIAALLKMQAG
jgi:ribonuclease HI